MCIAQLRQLGWVDAMHIGSERGKEFGGGRSCDDPCQGYHAHALKRAVVRGNAAEPPGWTVPQGEADPRSRPRRTACSPLRHGSHCGRCSAGPDNSRFRFLAGQVAQRGRHVIIAGDVQCQPKAPGMMRVICVRPDPPVGGRKKAGVRCKALDGAARHPQVGYGAEGRGDVVEGRGHTKVLSANCPRPCFHRGQSQAHRGASERFNVQRAPPPTPGAGNCAECPRGQFWFEVVESGEDALYGCSFRCPGSSTCWVNSVTPLSRHSWARNGSPPPPVAARR